MSPQSPTDFFAVDVLSEQALPDGNLLARNARNGRALVLPPDVFDALGSCRAFRTLDQHVAALTSAHPESAGREGDVRALLQHVRRAGLTQEASDVLQRLSPTPAPKSLGPGRAIILTWERPAALQRLLSKLCAGLASGSVDRLFVVDDSRASAVSAENRAIVDRLGETAPRPMHYFGGDDSNWLVGQLRGELPEHRRAINCLLGRPGRENLWTAGISRSLGLLLSVGSRAVVFDDDTLFQLHPPPIDAAGVEFSLRERRARFFAGNDDWPKADPDRDPVSEHLSCLGLTLPQALSRLGLSQPRAADLVHTGPRLAGSLVAESAVRVTQCGSLGDPGTDSNNWLTILDPESRAALTTDKQVLALALSQRNCWLGHARPMFSPQSNISQVTGLDHRVFLPPYFPIGRGQDALFGSMLRQIEPLSMALEYPWAVPHLPDPPRQWNQSQQTFAPRLLFPGSLTFEATRRASNAGATSTAIRLQRLAAEFADLAASPKAEIVDRYATSWEAARVARIDKLRRLHDLSQDASTAWREFVERALRQAQCEPVSDWSRVTFEQETPHQDWPDALAFWRETWRGFGQGLLAWDDICEASAHLLKARFSG